MKCVNKNITMVSWWSIVIFVLSTTVVNAELIHRDALELAYLFDEGAGNVAKDHSGHSRHGEISGAIYVEGVFGTGLQYDGVDDNVVVPDYAGVGGADARTTVFWFKAAASRGHSWVKWGTNSGV